MEAVRMLVTAVVAGLILYVASMQIAPFLEPQTPFAKAAESVLLDAQSELGKSASISLTIAGDQSIFARNFNEPTRNVAFSCAGNECCPIFEGCTNAYASTAERIITYRKTEVSLTARCADSGVGVHACTLYIGREPAQVVWQNIQSESETIQAGETIAFSGTIRNTGELSTGALRVRAEVWGTQFENGKEKEVKISEETSGAENIDAGQSSSARIETRILTPGEYRVRVIVEGENAGSDEEVFVLRAEGEMVSLCDADTSRAFEKSVDGFLNMCREKRFCTRCGFAFECRNVWETAQPASGEGYYDTTRGESGFTYYLTPLSPSGTC